LSTRVNISQYAVKLYENAEILVEEENEIIKGLVAFYCNDTIDRIAYITLIVVFPKHEGMGIGRTLLNETFRVALSCNMKQIKLEVNKTNKAVEFYKKYGFVTSQIKGDNLFMIKEL